MNWKCPRCDCALGEVSGLAASCPMCGRAYTCVTEEERKRIDAHRKSHKPEHGPPLPTKYVEPPKPVEPTKGAPMNIPQSEAFAAWIEPNSGDRRPYLYSGRTGHFKTAKACLRSVEGRFPNSKVTVIKTQVVWEKAEVQSL